METKLLNGVVVVGGGNSFFFFFVLQRSKQGWKMPQLSIWKALPTAVQLSHG